MDKMYYIGENLTISLISNYSHTFCYYVIKQNGNSIKLFPQICEKMIILLPVVEKVYNLGCFSLKLSVTDDLTISMNRDDINATVIFTDSINEQESEVKFQYEQFVSFMNSFMMLSADILTD